MPGTATRPLVVVGVDGSAQAQAALAWAAGYAEAIGGRVRAVIAWDAPPNFGYVPLALDEDFAADAAIALDHALTVARKEHPGLPLEPRVVHGHPLRVLLDAAEDAALVVVGSHGRGAFAGALLGSVPNRLVHHAHCPVVVVRDGAAAARHDQAA